MRFNGVRRHFAGLAGHSKRRLNIAGRFAKPGAHPNKLVEIPVPRFISSKARTTFRCLVIAISESRQQPPEIAPWISGLPI